MGLSGISNKQQFLLDCKNSAIEKAFISADQAYPEDCVEKREWFYRKYREYYRDMAFPPCHCLHP
jgi:hypothetical protein